MVALTLAEKILIKGLLPEIRVGYPLRWMGLHGAGHWARVLLNGLTVAAFTGADRGVVMMFSLFHDSRRLNDLHDPSHGRRGGRLALELLRGDPAWPRERLKQLVFACSHHTDTRHHQDVTVQTCWDADRLDLSRIGAEVSVEFLGAWARHRADIIEAASDRARQKVFPYPDVFREPQTD